MRLPLFAFALLPAVAFAQGKSSKPQVSANGVFSVRLVELAEDKCEVEVTKDQQPAWKLEKCLGSPDDLYFVSSDGDRIWVLKSLGEKPARAKKAQRVPWFAAQVATLFDKDGNVLKARKVADLVPSQNRADVRQLERHFKWLEGVAGVPGKGPRVNDKNEVEFEVVGGKSYRLPF